MGYWFWFALCAAFFTALTDATIKAVLKGLSPMEMALVRFMAPLPFLLPSIALLKVPSLGAGFWATVIILVPFEILAMDLYMKALKGSEMSLSLPMLAFTPSFIILTGWVILGERVSLVGALGIILTVIGAYLLFCDTARTGLLAPLRALFHHKGARLMLMVAAIYSITSCLGKRAILWSSPEFFAPFYFALLGVVVPVFFSLAWKRNAPLLVLKKVVANGGKSMFAMVLVGIFQSIMVYSHMLAISLSNAAYMIAVKRTSIIFSILLGAMLFKEGPLTTRLPGGLLMLAGVWLVATQ